MKHLFLIIFILSLATVNAQDIKTNLDCGATYNATTDSYNVVLTGISMKKAVDLMVDQIKSRSSEPQQVSDYIVEYSGTYSISSPTLGFPLQFKTIAEVRAYIKKELKLAFENL